MSEVHAVLSELRVREKALWDYLREHLDGFSEPAEMSQFLGGQSNPTYLISTPSRKFVLRKKPPGLLVATAHLIEREYQVQRALTMSIVPVAPPRLFCADPAVIGTPFYVMDYIDGVIYSDVALRALAPEHRRACYESMINILAKIHTLDYRECGLANFGKPNRYIERQIERWAGQHAKFGGNSSPVMDRLASRLSKRIPIEQAATLIHGDFRLANIMFEPSGAGVSAVLDWELSTLGHPLLDLAFCCLAHYLPSDTPTFGGLAGQDLMALNIPTAEEMLYIYCRAVNRESIDDWAFFVAFAFFRLAAISEGIVARARQGNAVDGRAAEFAEIARLMAELGD